MDADWSVECGGDDPFVVVPWQNASGSLTYINLRANPEALEQIPEAKQYPVLAAALRSWNQASSPLFTAKCDVWSYTADLFDAEDLPGFAYARGSYVDLLFVDADRFENFSAAEMQLRRWTEMARGVDAPGISLSDARCEWILRRAMIAESSNTIAEEKYAHGYATTLYVWGYGNNAEEAAAAWEHALRWLIAPILVAAVARDH